MLFFAAGRYRVMTVAPDGQRSAAGHSMNLFNPLRLTRSLGVRHAIVALRPIVSRVALSSYLSRCGGVVSGIIYWPQHGRGYYYSGNVARAREGAINGIPGIAISMNNWRGGGDYEAAGVAVHFRMDTGP
jgi:5'-nucleotidase